MSCAMITKRPRKPGSGRKRKVDALTSADYARMLENHQRVPGMSPAEEKEFKKKKRALKNRMSALKSRERKRARMDELQQQVLLLQQQVASLKQENLSLRQNRDINIAPRKNVLKVSQPLVGAGCQPGTTACNTSSSPANSTFSAVVPADDCGQTVSVYDSVSISNSSPSCAPESEPAVFTPRGGSLLMRVAAQYSLLPSEMPWRNLRSIFLTLWISVQMLVSTRSSTVRKRLKQKIFALRRAFSKTLQVSCRRKEKRLAMNRKENRHAGASIYHDRRPHNAVFNRIVHSLFERAKDRHSHRQMTKVV